MLQIQGSISEWLWYIFEGVFVLNNPNIMIWLALQIWYIVCSAGINSSRNHEKELKLLLRYLAFWKKWWAPPCPFLLCFVCSLCLVTSRWEAWLNLLLTFYVFWLSISWRSHIHVQLLYFHAARHLWICHQICVFQSPSLNIYLSYYISISTAYAEGILAFRFL